MAKTKVRKVKAKKAPNKVRRVKEDKSVLTIIRGWMFVVAFALMLGIGAIVGTYFNNLLNEGVPTVAGSSIELFR